MSDLPDKRPPIVQYIHDFVEKVREPLGLDRWQIHLLDETPAEDVDCKASNTANPEYKTTYLRFHIDRLETGDELDELIVHELTHCHTWGVHTLAEENAIIAADCLPEGARDAFKRGMLEQARIAGEDATTQLAFCFIRLLRRMWKLEAELKALKKRPQQVKTAE
jgi:hypothetical protein